MENRFGVKDFVLFGLVLGLIGLVSLSMVQFDRQFDKVNAVAKGQSDQAGELAKIEATLKSWGTGRPAVAAAATGPAVADGPDPFARVRAAAAMPDYAPGDTLISSGPRSSKLTPLLDTDAFAATIQGFVIQSLVTRDPVSLKYQGLLASPGWTVTDHVADYLAYRKAHPVPDGAAPPDDPACPVPLTITFDIRPEATFSDGDPVTADDVVWTFDWVMNKTLEASRQRSGLSKIRRVVKIGDRRVRFDFAEPYFDYLGLAGGMDVLPAHWYRKTVPTPEAYNKIPCALLGSGPYMLPDPVGWHPNDEVVLVRNDRFWGPKPALSSIRYKVIVQDEVRLTAFKNQELDVLGASPVQYDALLKDPAVVGRTQHVEYDTANAGYRFVAWNQVRNGKPTRFADKRVRQAMTMLIDRQRMCDELLLGKASVVTGPFNKLGKQCDPSIRPWPFDVAKAQALLAECGYTDDGSGSLKDRDGRPFRFTLTYPSGQVVVDRMVLFMKDTMAQAGVTLDDEQLDWSVFSERLKSHDFDAIMLGWTAGLEDDIYQMFDSAQIANGAEDWVSYKNPELDQLIEQARGMVDEDRRTPLWRRCHAILHDDQPYTFLMTAKALVFLDARFNNVQRVPLGLNDRTEWFVPSTVQKYRQ